MDLITDALIEAVREYARTAEKSERFEHSLRVADTARKLCRRFGLDEEKGFLAGLSHDICKNMDKKELYDLVKSHGVEITELEENKPGLLHGKGAAILLKEKFNYDEENVLEAVANHTMGRKGLCPLGRCLFIADRTEPGRKHLTAEYMKNLENLGLNQTCLKLLEDNMAYLKENGLTVAPVSYEYQKFLIDEINGGSL